MTGMQETLVLGLREIAAAIEAGKYGNDDDIDYEATFDDVEDLFTKVG